MAKRSITNGDSHQTESDTSYSKLDIPDGMTRLDYLRKVFENELQFVTDDMDDLVRAIDKAAGRKDPVLILGESGTGKEKTAQAIHHVMSLEGTSTNLLSVSCADFTETLIESELFGHEKGAFTGANKRRIGKLEQANGGTLFLDEIGKLSKGSQAKLLRVLESNEIYRVGGNEIIPVNVRLIAATSASSVHDIENGDRQNVLIPELYYRLDKNKLRLQSLSERSPAARRKIIQYGLDVAPNTSTRRNENTKLQMSPDDIDYLGSKKFHGNVRELLSVISDIYSEAEYAELNANGHIGDVIKAERSHIDLALTHRFQGAMNEETQDRYFLERTLEILEAVHCDSRTVGKIMSAFRLLTAIGTHKIKSMRDIKDHLPIHFSQGYLTVAVIADTLQIPEEQRPAFQRKVMDSPALVWQEFIETILKK